MVRRLEGGLSTTFQSETAAVRREVSLVSAVRGDFFQAVDVPVLVMCPCWRGLTSPAPRIQVEVKNKIDCRQMPG